MRKIHWITFIIILLIPVSGILFYPHMPEKMGVHWQFGKTPDGYTTKFNAVVYPAIYSVILPGFLLTITILISKFVSKQGKNIILFFLSYFTFLFSAFLTSVYIAVLLWNYGIDFSVPIFICIGVSVLIISIIILIISMVYQQQKFKPSTIAIYSDGKYKDSLVEINGDTITFKDYYFPMGSKFVNFSQVEYVLEKTPTVWNGKWRMHGTGDLLFRIWFPADYNRPNRDKIFVMKLKHKWIKIGFTAEDSKTVSEIFKERGLIQ